MRYGLNNDKVSGSETLLDKNSINHAKGEIRQITRKTIQRLNHSQLINKQDRQSSTDRLNEISAHAQDLLSSLRNQSQVDALLNEIKLTMHKILASNRLSVVVQLVINKVNHASLTDEQQLAAVAEVKSSGDYASESLKDASNDSEIQDAVTSGVNAINGALSKYVVDSQINAVSKVKVLIRELKHHVNRSQRLQSDTKIMLIDKLNTLQNDRIEKLMISNNFMELALRQQNCLAQLKRFLHDQSDLFTNLINFDKLIQQTKEIIVSLSMPSGKKLQLEHQIDASRDSLLTDIKNNDYQDIDDALFENNQRHIILIIIDAVSLQNQRVIASKTSSLNNGQRRSLIDQIKLTAQQISDDLKEHLSVKPKEDLIKGITRLNDVIQQHRNFIYVDHIQKFARNVEAQVNQQVDLPAYYRQILKHQIINLSNRLQKHYVNDHDAQDKLYGFYHHQVHDLEVTLLKYYVMNLVKQIQFSHLSKEQKQSFVHQLSTIQKNPELNYGNRQLFIKNLKDYCLKVDRNEIINRLTRLGKQMMALVNPLNKPTLNQKLVLNLQNFKLDVTRFSRIVDLDHQGQSYENMIYSEVYQLNINSGSPKDKAFDQSMKIFKRAHHRFDFVILDHDMHQICTDQMDKAVNHRINKIMQLSAPQALDQQVSSLQADVKSVMKNSLANVKLYYGRQIDQDQYDFQHQLMIHVTSKDLDPLFQVRYRAMAKLRNSNNLLHVEAIRQQCAQQMIQIVSQVLDKYDRVKAEAHEKINHLVSVVKSQVSHHGQLIDNQIMQIINQANAKINQVVDDQVTNVYKHCYQALDQVIRYDYLQRWNDFVDNASRMITKVVNVDQGHKDQAAQSIQMTMTNTITELKTCDRAKLDHVLTTMQDKIQKIVNHTIFLDPIKRGARSQLDRLIDQIKMDIDTTVATKQRNAVKKQLDTMNQSINQKLSVSNDENVQKLLHLSEKRLNKFQLKMIMDYQLRHYNKLSRDASQKINAFKYLADEQLREANSKLNHYYHKTIYDIQKSPDAQFCKHNAIKGIQSLKNVVSHYQTINKRKQRILQTIKLQIEQAQQNVDALKLLKPNDKKSSQKLLKQTYQQAVQGIKSATAAKQIFAAEKKSSRVSQWVVNEVSSADVLLSAIKSADTEISKSALDTRQKQATLEQIHQIINNGIKSQAEASKSNQSQSKARKPRVAPKETFRNMKKTAKPDTKRNPIGVFFSSIGHFFKWLFGKFAQAF